MAIRNPFNAVDERRVPGNEDTREPVQLWAPDLLGGDNETGQNTANRFV
jgi:hypothetical protein